MTLTYWYAENLSDSNAYSIRAKTKKACLAERNAQAETPDAEASEATPYSGQYTSRFGPVIKVTVEYANAFDLMSQCLGEGGLLEQVGGIYN